MREHVGVALCVIEDTAQRVLASDRVARALYALSLVLLGAILGVGLTVIG